MPRFLFWNVAGREIKDIIVDLAIYKDVDILVLAEFTIDISSFLISINSKSTSTFIYHPQSICKKITVFARFRSTLITNIEDENRSIVKKVDFPGYGEFLLACVHFPSKIHWDNESQMLEATRLANSINSAEDNTKIFNTILVGDLNMNPFEGGMVGAAAIHGVMSADIAKANSGFRTVSGIKYRKFYNPMWRLMGDDSKHPPGTIYSAQSKHISYFWNTFDQVLIRPGLIDDFHHEQLEIIHNFHSHNLLNSSGITSKEHISDHLPLFFSLG